MSTTRYRLLVPVLGALSVFILAGCTLGAPQPQPPTTTDEPLITGQEDGVGFSIGANLPADWPADVPTPDNATAAFSNKEQDPASGTTTYSATFALNEGVNGLQAIDQLADVYRGFGWSVSTTDFSELQGLGAGFEATRGDDQVGVSFIGAPGESGDTQGSITIIATLAR